MPPKQSSRSKGKQRIVKPYLSGEALNEELNRMPMAPVLDSARLPWYLRHPELPPPANRMKTVTKDQEGRMYNFPIDKPDEVHVKLKRAPPRWDGNREVMFPVVGDTIELLDGRSFFVDSVIIGPHRQITATLSVTWL